MDLNEKIRNKYDKASKLYDIFEQPMELMGLKKWRVETLKETKGKTLEIGVGTGKNIPFYNDTMEYTAIDFSVKMLEKAQKKKNIYNKKVELIQMDVQEMSFPDNTFDCIITTCVFCSVPDPVKGLKEIMRVCKPNGKIIMLEHVRSENKILGEVMDLLNPFIVNLYGANINRRTLDNIKTAGFTINEETDLFADVVKRIIIYNVKELILN